MQQSSQRRSDLLWKLADSECPLSSNSGQKVRMLMFFLFMKTRCSTVTGGEADQRAAELGLCSRSVQATDDRLLSSTDSSLAEAFTVCQLLGTSWGAVHFGKWSQVGYTPRYNNLPHPLTHTHAN